MKSSVAPRSHREKSTKRDYWQVWEHACQIVTGRTLCTHVPIGTGTRICLHMFIAYIPSKSHVPMYLCTYRYRYMPVGTGTWICRHMPIAYIPSKSHVPMYLCTYRYRHMNIVIRLIYSKFVHIWVDLHSSQSNHDGGISSILIFLL